MTFLQPASLSLDVLSTRRPRGAPPLSSTFKPPSSMFHHHLLMSSVPGALLEHLHPPPSTSHHLLGSSPPSVLLGRLHAPHPTADAAPRLCPARCPSTRLRLCHRSAAHQHVLRLRSGTCGTLLVPPRAPAWLCHPTWAQGQSLDPISPLRLGHHLSPQARTGGNHSNANPPSAFPTLQPTSPATWVPRR